MIHITFLLNDSEFFARGKNYNTTDPLQAVQQWRSEYPDAVFISAATKQN